jgi:hypothetical protein
MLAQDDAAEVTALKVWILECKNIIVKGAKCAVGPMLHPMIERRARILYGTRRSSSRRIASSRALARVTPNPFGALGERVIGRATLRQYDLPPKTHKNHDLVVPPPTQVESAAGGALTPQEALDGIGADDIRPTRCVFFVQEPTISQTLRLLRPSGGVM